MPELPRATAARLPSGGLGGLAASAFNNIKNRVTGSAYAAGGGIGGVLSAGARLFGDPGRAFNDTYWNAARAGLADTFDPNLNQPWTSRVDDLMAGHARDLDQGMGRWAGHLTRGAHLTASTAATSAATLAGGQAGLAAARALPGASALPGLARGVAQGAALGAVPSAVRGVSQVAPAGRKEWEYSGSRSRAKGEEGRSGRRRGRGRPRSERRHSAAR